MIFLIYVGDGRQLKTMEQSDREVPVSVQWFPGHMQKTRRLIKEHLKVVDVVLELLDARLPASSANPLLRDVLGDKPRVIVLNKVDLADEVITRRWTQYFQREKIPVAAINTMSGQGIRTLVHRVEEMARARREKFVHRNGRPRAARAMIVGIPNVGKSSLINRLAGQAKAKVENRPGVTRDRQWIRIGTNLELLDTPGILWPKFEDPAVGMKLAFVGSVSEDAYDGEALAMAYLSWMCLHYPVHLQTRYQLTEDILKEEPATVLKAIGKKRGCLLKGGLIDYDKVRRLLLSEFRGGKVGTVSFEEPPEPKESEEAGKSMEKDGA